MLDHKILERARGVINPAVDLRRKALHSRVGEILGEMSARGVLRSSMTLQQIAARCETELRDRTLLSWEHLRRVYAALGSPKSPTLASDLKHEVGIHRQEAYRELSAILQEHIANVGLSNSTFLQQLNLNEADLRAQMEVDGEIDLYVDSLSFIGIQSTPPDSLVFISCGQYTQEEIALGEALARVVTERLAPFKGYFAQVQTSLDGLSRNIFGAINQCAGFVAVMHHRGTVSTLNGVHVRASPWIEQELAIAAFLTQAQQRSLAVVGYVQKGIKREGVREQLHLNPIEFSESAEVIDDFNARISDGRFKPAMREHET
jgi:hypothetical protein